MSALVIVLALAGMLEDPKPIAEEPIRVTLQNRRGEVTPHTRRDARADGGLIEVRVPSPNSVVAVMTGSVSAYTHMGLTSRAGERFHLEQEFDLSSDDPKVRAVTLTLHSSMTGYARSRHKASTGIRLAAVSVQSLSAPAPPLVLEHAPLATEGTESRLVNAHLPELESVPMPLGRYLLTMDFVIEAEAGGIFDGHATTELSPGTTLPDSWVRTRDPFQGIDKTGFGFSATLAATPADLKGPAGEGPFHKGASVRARTLDQRATQVAMPASSPRTASPSESQGPRQGGAGTSAERSSVRR